MAPERVLAATTLLVTMSLASAYGSSYGNSLYARTYDKDLFNTDLYSRSIQKVLARRDLIEEEYDDTFLHTRRQPCGTGYLSARSAEPLDTHPGGCLCDRHMAIREADAEADPIGDALFEHDDILFNYKRAAEGEGSFFDDLEFFDLIARELDSRDADAEADPTDDALFEHDNILFNYRRSIDIRDADAEAESEADPVGDALFENDDILFNYRRSLNPFEDIEFTDLISRAESGYTPWFESATAQARKGEYKSPGTLKAEGRVQNGAGGGRWFGMGGANGAGFGGASDGSMGAVGGLGGHAFNEALDAGSAGASSMDAAALDAGGIGM